MWGADNDSEPLSGETISIVWKLIDNMHALVGGAVG